MDVAFTDKAKEHLAEWKMSGNKAAMKKIAALLINMQDTPFTGIGKPEELKYNLADFGRGG